MGKIDLNKAGGRLRYSIECITGKAFNEFADTVKSVAKRTLYNWIDKDELISKKLNPLLEDLPGLSFEYIIHNNQSQKPQSEFANNLQITKEADNEIKNNTMKTPPKVEQPAIIVKNKVRTIKKPKKPVTLERRKKLKESSKRMQEVKSDFQMNTSELEVHLKITHSLISNVLDMRNAMTKTVATPLSDEYGYNYDWLMYGKLPKMKSKRTHVKIAPVEKIEPPQSEFIIELLKENAEILKDKVKLLEKVNTLEEKLERQKRFGGSGVIPKTTTKIVKTKKAG